MTLLRDVEDAIRLGLVDVHSFRAPHAELLVDWRGVVHSHRACPRLPRWPLFRRAGSDVLSVPRSRRCRCFSYPDASLTPSRRTALEASLPLVRLDRAVRSAEDLLAGGLNPSRLPLVLSELRTALDQVAASTSTSPLRAHLLERARRADDLVSARLRSRSLQQELLQALRARHWSRDSLVWDDSLAVVDLRGAFPSAAQGDALALLEAFRLRWPDRLLLLLPAGAVPLVRTAFGTASLLAGEVGPDPSEELLELFLGLWDPSAPGPLAGPDAALEAARALLSGRDPATGG